LAWQISEGIDGVVAPADDRRETNPHTTSTSAVVETSLEVANGRRERDRRHRLETRRTRRPTSPAMPRRPAPPRAWSVLPYYNKPTPEGRSTSTQGVHDAYKHSDRDLKTAAATHVEMGRHMARVAKITRVIGVPGRDPDLAARCRPSSRSASSSASCRARDATGFAVPDPGAAMAASRSIERGPEMTHEMPAPGQKEARPRTARWRSTSA